MKKITYLFVLLITILISCNHKSLNTKKPVKNIQLEEFNDISYYENKSEQPKNTRLNIVMPENVENPPVLVWIGQGAWAYVNRHVEMDICRQMAQQGICVISVGHRLSPALLWEPMNDKGVQHPEHIKDIALAFKWVYKNADKYGYDANNIFIGGYSSGAHLAALLVTDTTYLNNVGMSSTNIKAIIPVAGGYDIPHYREIMLKEDPAQDRKHFIPVFGETMEDYINASPTNFIDNLNTPMLLVSEKESYAYTKFFEKRLIEHNKTNFEVLHILNKGHAELWRELGHKNMSSHRDYIVNYIKQMSN